MKLLNIDANAKTVKGQARGYMTAVLYLAPWRSAGVNVCPTAEIAGCHVSCLNTAGRGGIAAKRATFKPYGVTLPDNAIQRARITRTRLFADHRAAFMQQLVEEIAAFVRKAERKGLEPCVRLNGTSDIVWESVPAYSAVSDSLGEFSIFDRFPRVQFYDYTKLPGRLSSTRSLPANYHLSISWSGADASYARKAEACARETGAPLVVIVPKYQPDNEAQWGALWQLRARADCTHVVDGDESDLRFLEKPHALVVLKAKGLARLDRSGFVLNI